MLTQIFDQVKKPSVVMLIFCLALTGCSQTSSRISYDRLQDEGFYVYVLPEDEVAQRGWEQEIGIWSFDKHCKGLTIDETYNPLIVRYTDPIAERPNEGLPKQSLFEVQLGPWVPPWASGGEWVDAELELEFVDGGISRYKVWPRSDGETFLGMRFTDTFEQQVFISSWLSFTETVSLINQLNYVGPPPEQVENPWDCSR